MGTGSAQLRADHGRPVGQAERHGDQRNRKDACEPDLRTQAFHRVDTSYKVSQHTKHCHSAIHGASLLLRVAFADRRQSTNRLPIHPFLALKGRNRLKTTTRLCQVCCQASRLPSNQNIRVLSNCCGRTNHKTVVHKTHPRDCSNMLPNMLNPSK